MNFSIQTCTVDVSGLGWAKDLLVQELNDMLTLETVEVILLVGHKTSVLERTVAFLLERPPANGDSEQCWVSLDLCFAGHQLFDVPICPKISPRL